MSGRRFKPIKRKPGEVIRAEDWNKIQEDVEADLRYLEERLGELRRYVDSLLETTKVTNLESPIGRSYPLNEDVPGWEGNFGVATLGLITRQWVLGSGERACMFGVMDRLDALDFWAAANRGDREVLEVIFEYIDGTSHSAGPLYIQEVSRLRPREPSNPYVEYLLSPKEWVFYKYRVRNPHPDREVLRVVFRVTVDDALVRIGNVMQYYSRLVHLEEL